MTGWRQCALAERARPGAEGVEDIAAAPRAFRLLPGAPTPFRGPTTIAYELAADAPVRLWVFDVAGRLVRRLENALRVSAGRYELRWDGRDEHGRKLGARVYFYRLDAGHPRTRNGWCCYGNE